MRDTRPAADPPLSAAPACDNATVPSYAQPPIEPPLRPLVDGLGANQVRLALIVALARAGGTLDTTELIEQVALPRVTALRNLAALEGAGYVVSSDPPGTRRGGRRALWTLDPERVRTTLAAVVEHTTPTTKDDDQQ